MAQFDVGRLIHLTLLKQRIDSRVHQPDELSERSIAKPSCGDVIKKGAGPPTADGVYPD